MQAQSASPFSHAACSAVYSGSSVLRQEALSVSLTQPSTGLTPSKDQKVFPNPAIHRCLASDSVDAGCASLQTKHSQSFCPFSQASCSAVKPGSDEGRQLELAWSNVHPGMGLTPSVDQKPPASQWYRKPTSAAVGFSTSLRTRHWQFASPSRHACCSVVKPGSD